MNSFEEAIEVIEKYGWRQGSVGSTTQGFCLSGALGHVALQHQEQWGNNDVRTWTTHLCHWRYFFSDTMKTASILNWNDTYNRKKSDVLEALRVVAKAWANKEVVE